MSIQLEISPHTRYLGILLVLACLGVYTFVTSRLWQDDRIEWNVPPPLRRRYLRFDASYRADQARAQANLSLSALYDRLEQRTANSTVLNWARFGPLQADTPTLVVLAHRDAERIQYLIVSLAQVRNIRSIFLVFSHSYYDENIDDLVKSIDFCMVKQIYYPNSVQLYPTSFPGTDVGDCTNRAAANNSQRCSLRDGRRSEGKHHWWWTAHTVFGEPWPWFKGHRGMVMFVREDTYVLPDLVYMMSFAQRALSHIPEVEVISFGRPQAKNLDYNKFSIAIWKPIYENGLTFNRSTWAKIVDQSVQFCEYDDISWSYSLLAAFGQWPRGRALTVASVAPRVVSTGAYGSGQLALAALVPELRARAAAARMFPREGAGVQALVFYDREGMRFEFFKLPPHGNGGWSDYRDHNLCLEPLMATNTEDDSTTTTPNFDTIKTNSRL